MSQNNSKGSFFDSKTIMSIVLVGLSWMAWQGYMKKKYPQAFQKTTQNQETHPNSESGSDLTQSGSQPDSNILKTQGSQINNIQQANKENTPEVLIHFEDDTWSFDFSSKGMGIRNLKLKKYTDRKGELVSIGEGVQSPVFATYLIGDSIPEDFSLTQTGPLEFKGESLVNGMKITKIVRVKSNQYVLDTEIFLNDIPSQFLGVSTSMTEAVTPSSGGHFMLPDLGHQEVFTYSQNEKNRVKVSSGDLNKLDLNQDNIQVAAFGTHYFAQAIVDRSELFPRFKSQAIEKDLLLTGKIEYIPASQSNSLNIRYQAFAGPKLFEKLESISPELSKLVDFGMFSWIAKYILKMMKWFYSLLGNWGLAIILLTIIVRLVVLPFALVSFKSMKNMQAIQPQIKILREKYKEDQTTLNQEMMRLMKTHKVNPLGGCLPMFLQFPVFIALYQVLGQSIELYQAPFGLWIHDLSLKDPFYVLPVLMGVTMFVQQKITPNTMDPAQARILMFMPIIFTFFMVSLPSGLTLYIFVSSLFGILQQVYFLRDKSKLAVIEATTVK